MRKILVIAFLFCCSAGAAVAQQLGVKTNAVHWAAAGTHKEENKKLKFWSVMPEFRYWLCERFNGHFFGLHTGYGEYNISRVRVPFLKKSMRDHRYQGWATGLGISYGYSWLLGKRWNLEATLGFGYVYTKFDRYECATCGEFRGSNDRHYFGPTKAGISIIYIIK